MAFAAGFGLDVGLTAVSLAASLWPQPDKPTAKIGIGSQAAGESGGDLSGGLIPVLYIYDTQGKQFGFASGGFADVDPASNPTSSFADRSSTRDLTTTPEYMKLSASGTDAVCVSYVAHTSAADDKRIWHAGYVKQCADIFDGNFWYPSPEIIPGTDFRPGCVWLSADDRFLQSISFKLTDFGFPDSATANTAQDQYTQFPNTLCQAPGRMAFWKDNHDNIGDCIPHYDPNALQKNATTGFDLDFQLVVDGHKIDCDLGGATFWNQTIEPGKGPKTLTPQQILDEQAAQEAADEAGTNTDAPPPGQSGFGGSEGSIPVSEAGQDFTIGNTATYIVPTSTDIVPTQTPGVGSFGRVVSSIPNPGAGSFAGVVSSIPNPSAVPASKPKRSNIQQSRAEAKANGVLARREALRQGKDHCVDKIVISHLKDHSAREACEMSHSWGPDFASIVEGTYCDMCEREIWDVCDTSKSTNCFDVEMKEVRSSSYAGANYEKIDLKKRFEVVEEWQ